MDHLEHPIPLLNLPESDPFRQHHTPQLLIPFWPLVLYALGPIHPLVHPYQLYREHPQNNDHHLQREY